MNTKLYRNLKNREEIGKRVRNYIKIETKKGEDKRMNKKEFIRMYKDFKGEKESKKNFCYVRLPQEFVKGETMTMLEKINKTAYWMFIEMVFETSRTLGLIQNNTGLLRRIITNTERNVGHKLTIDEIVKAINTLIGFRLIKKTIIGIRILNYCKFYYSA